MTLYIFVNTGSGNGFVSFAKPLTDFHSDLLLTRSLETRTILVITSKPQSVDFETLYLV